MSAGVGSMWAMCCMRSTAWCLATHVCSRFGSYLLSQAVLCFERFELPMHRT